MTWLGFQHMAVSALSGCTRAATQYLRNARDGALCSEDGGNENIARWSNFSWNAMSLHSIGQCSFQWLDIGLWPNSGEVSRGFRTIELVADNVTMLTATTLSP